MRQGEDVCRIVAAGDFSPEHYRAYAGTHPAALLIAADILDNSPYEKMLAERYASYDQGEGKAFEEGRLTLEQVADYARKHEPVQRSGKQELYEAIVNMYI